MAGSSGWVEVFFTYDEVEAEILRDMLLSGGIPVRLVSHKVAPYPVNIGKMGEIKLLVRQENEEEARRLLETFSLDADASAE